MDFVQQMLAIILVLSLLALGLKLAHRRGLVRINLPVKGPLERKLELVDRLALTPQHAIHVVRAGSRMLVVATYVGGITWMEQGGASESLAEMPQTAERCLGDARKVQSAQAGGG